MVVSRANLSGRPLPKKQGNIEDWDWMDFAPVHTARVFRHKKEKSITLRLASRITANGAHAFFEMVGRSTGVAVLPQFIVEPEVRAGNLTVLLPKWQLPSFSAYAVWPSNAPREGRTAELVKAIATEL